MEAYEFKVLFDCCTCKAAIYIFIQPSTSSLILNYHHVSIYWPSFTYERSHNIVAVVLQCHYFTPVYICTLTALCLCVYFNLYQLGVFTDGEMF